MVIKKFWNQCVLKPSCCSIARSCPTLCDLWTVACQAPLSMRFPWQEYWHHFLLQGTFPDQRSNPHVLLWQVGSVPLSRQGSPCIGVRCCYYSVAKSCPELCDPMDCSTPGFPVFTSLNSCPLSWWCHPTISSSVAPSSSCPQSLPVSSSFPMSWLFVSGYFFFNIFKKLFIF